MPRIAPRRSDARANHEALIAAAVELFGRVGSAAPYEDVAEAAGVGRATLYRHFPTREDLFVAIFDATLERLEVLARSLDPGPERFGALFDACVREQQQNLPLLQLATRSTPSAERRRLRGRFQELFRAPLAEARAAGVAAPGTTVVDVRVVLLMLSGVLGPAIDDADRRRAVQLARGLLVTG
jgi:AcrR family transcriptional regulator